VNDLTLSIETAGGAFYDAAQLAEGDPGAAQDDTRATVYLSGAEMDASDLHLSACEHAIKRIDKANSGGG
jgi:hypothetical protein